MTSFACGSPPAAKSSCCNDPRHIETVLLTQRTNFIKHTFFWRHVTAIFGKGLLTSEGDFWLRQRRLAAPAFHPDRIASYGETMSRFADRHAAGWTDGESRDIHRDMMRVTMEIVAKTLFDAEVRDDLDEVGSAFDLVIREIATRFRRPFRIPDAVPTPGNLRYRRGVARLDRLVARILEERRARPGDRGDLLSMLLAARDDDGQAMSDQQLRDETVTLFLAGHETTAIALSWTFYLLALHPEADAALHEELRGALAGRLPAVSDLPRLRYTEAVVRESMRLYPPAYVIGREARRRLRDRRLPGRGRVRPCISRPGSSIGTAGGSTARRSSAPRAGWTAWRAGFPNTSTSPSAEARGSASASGSR